MIVSARSFQRPTSLFATLLLVLLLSSFSGCKDDDGSASECKPTSTSINIIMPLGASRVEGDRPEFESFRYELWKQLVDGGWDFDYIGSRTDLASYPDYAGLSFDPDHEGRGGWTSGQILDGLNEWLENVGTPDIVLFSSPGGNDMLNGSPAYSEVISNINAIIDLLQAANPNVTILLERLAPGKSNFMTSSLTNAFQNMQADLVTIAAQQTNADSEVIAIDMYTGFNDSFLADDVHYNTAGAKFIADRYYPVLETILRTE